MPDPYSSMSDTLVSPASNAFNISASSDDLAYIPKGIHCNASGTITCDFLNGATGLSIAVVAGMYYPYRLKKVTNLGTATLVGLY